MNELPQAQRTRLLSFAAVGLAFAMGTAVARAETFEMVTDQAFNGEAQFVSEGLGYGPGPNGNVRMLDGDVISDLLLDERGREVVGWVHFSSRDEGVVGSVNVFSDNTRLNLWRTSDGGTSWEEFAWFNAFGNIPNVAWYSDTSAYVVGADPADQSLIVAWHTDDRFATSSEVTFDGAPGGDKIDFGHTFQAATMDQIYALPRYYSHDGGDTWTQWDRLANSGSESTMLANDSVLFRQLDLNGGWATHVSHDDGATWTECTKPTDPAVERFRHISFLDDTLGLAIGAIFNDPNVVLRTDDGGLTWTLDEVPAELGEPVYVYYVSESVQYVQGIDGIARVGTPSASSNGGTGGNDGIGGSGGTGGNGGTGGSSGTGGSGSTGGASSSGDGGSGNDGGVGTAGDSADGGSSKKKEGGCTTSPGSSSTPTSGVLLTLLALTFIRRRVRARG